MVRRVHSAGGLASISARWADIPAERRTMCRSAVIALFGRTPREGTGGHVATRRGLDRINAAGRPPRGPLRGIAGSRAVARRWSRPGPRRDATRRRLGPNTPAMPGAVPVAAEGAWRRNRARGRCRKRHAAAAASDGSAKSVEGITQPDCESAESRKGRGLPITTQLPHARPASRGAAGRCRAPAASRGDPPRKPGARRGNCPLPANREIGTGRRGRRGGRACARLTGPTRRSRPSRAWRTGR